MWVDFMIAHFMGYSFVMIFWLTIMVRNPKKIFTGHELNQVVK